MYEIARDYSDCPSGSVGTFSTFGFLTFLLILLNVLLNLSELAMWKVGNSVHHKAISGTMSTILAINSINAANENSDNNNNVNGNSNENFNSRRLGQGPRVEGMAASVLRFAERVKVRIKLAN